MPMYAIVNAKEMTPPPVSSDVIQTLHAAYELGNSRAGPKHPLEEQEQSWRSGFRIMSMVQFPQESRRLYAAGKVACDQSRKLAMLGDTLSAWQQIAIAQERFKALAPVEELRLLAQSEVLSAEAAIEYQAANYTASRARLEAARLTDQEHTVRFNRWSSLAHGFHLVGKRVQLEAALRNFDRALQIAAAGLLILSGGSPLHGENSWPLIASLETQLPVALRYFLAQQLVVETSAALLYANANQARQALRLFSKELGPHAMVLQARPMTFEWLRAKLLVLHEDRQETHLLAWADFLENRRSDAETLWLLGALDAAKACASLDGRRASDFRRRVFQDLSRHAAFPARLRSSWSQLTAQ